MNKKGVTIIEILISISLISIVILLLIKVMFSLVSISNDKSYASDDELTRAEIMKKIEHDFLSLKLTGLKVIDNSTIEFYYNDTIKELKIAKDKLTYENEASVLKSKNATYDTCPKIDYQELDEKYYSLTITIPVLIDNTNNTLKDDIILSYIGLKKETNHFEISSSC